MGLVAAGVQPGRHQPGATFGRTMKAIIYISSVGLLSLSMFLAHRWFPELNSFRGAVLVAMAAMFGGFLCGCACGYECARADYED
jgi:hypothetical protein